jgi:hypothetical protein
LEVVEMDISRNILSLLEPHMSQIEIRDVNVELLSRNE